MRRVSSFSKELLEDPAWSSLRRMLWFAFSAVNERVLERLADRGYGEIRPRHATAIRCMDRDGTRLTVMAERAGVSKQAMGVVVDDLIAMGLVHIEPDPDDGRARRVRYTQKGGALVAAFIEADEETESEISELIGEAALSSLRSAMRSLVGQTLTR